MTRVESNQVRPQFANTSANTVRICWQIEGAQGTNLSVANKSGIRFNSDDGAVKNSNRLATTPFVGGLMERQFDAVGKNPGYFHRNRRMPRPMNVNSRPFLAVKI